MVLSSQLMREATFHFESLLFSFGQIADNHIFVAGLARSGTTILLNEIYESDNFASLSYADMPYVLAPNTFAKILPTLKNSKPIERAHGDGLNISTKSPEAFEEVFWNTFPDSLDDSHERFKQYIQQIMYKYKKTRYLSKNNQNIRRAELISEIFPHSKILIPFRSPTQQAYSLLTQHKKFIEGSQKDKFVSDYMRWIGHTEFGPNYIPLQNKNLLYTNDMDINHWLEQWCLVYKHCYETLKYLPNIHFISYEKLCRSAGYWHELLELLGISKSLQFNFIESKKVELPIIDKSLNQKAFNIYSQLDQLN